MHFYNYLCYNKQRGGAMANYKKGNIVTGTVTGIESYGVFVSFDEYYSGLIHISEISHGFVKDIHDYVKVGDVIKVEILEVDEETSHLKLSIKNIGIEKPRPSRRKKRKIEETPSGFHTLAQKLPYWIKENLKKQENGINSIDK